MTAAPNYEFDEVDVRQKDSAIRSAVVQAQIDNENVVVAYGLLLGTNCNKSIRVAVPVKRPDHMTIMWLDGVCAQVWFSPAAGNDWKVDVEHNWHQFTVSTMPNSAIKLHRPYYIFYEKQTHGSTNAVVHRIADGFPWAGNVLVLKQGLTPDSVDHVGVEDATFIQDVVAGVIRNSVISQQELPLDES